MPKPRPLTPNEASRSLVHRLGARVDRVRQIATKLGMRPYRVFLVWTRFGGEERGEGTEREVTRLELLPTPKVADLSALALSPKNAGLLPVGSCRLTEVSTTYTAEQLTGRVVPLPHEQQVPEPFDFFYELVPDGRDGTGAPPRARYRLSAQPWYDAENVQWSILLERTSEDRKPDGTSRLGED